MEKENSKLKESVATYGQGKAAVLEYKLAQEIAAKTIGLTADQASLVTSKLKDAAAEAISNARAYDSLAQSHKRVHDGSTTMLRDFEEQSSSMKRLSDFADTLSEHIGTNLADESFAKYNKAIRDANALTEDAIRKHNDFTKATEELTRAL